MTPLPPHIPRDSAVLVGTWSFSLAAIEAGWRRLTGNAAPKAKHAVAGDGRLLDAIEAACRHADLDPEVDSVGFGGLPDASGRMSLDGAIMESPLRFGGVCGLRRHLHPVAVARLVMDRTEHRLLCGEDADDFADTHGLESVELQSPEARAAFVAWRDRDPDATGDSSGSGDARLRPVDPGLGGPGGGRLFRPGDPPAGAAPFGHDTIGVLGRSNDGRLAAGCSTSGLPFKVPGRVGDSPIAGHGLFVEPGVGLATATGTGELISGISASFLAVETLRRGGTVLDAAREVVRRTEALGDLREHHQVAVVVMDAQGRIGSAALRPGFVLAVRDADGGRLCEPDFVQRPDDAGLPESAREGFAKSMPSPNQEDS
ncbi:MAG: hypothetical protein GY728_04590 [Phycisphaeraceae bacterium]|nr:hypothetical protein [Phycisphaeraceae bacterium]